METQERLSELKNLYKQVKGCTKCEIGRAKPFGCDPHVFVRGGVNAKIVFMGQNPGENEVRKNQPFIGYSGQILQNMINNELKLSSSEYLIYNSVLCYTPDNRTPTDFEIETCQPW